MAQVNARLDNAFFENVSKIQLLSGVNMTLELVEYDGPPVDYGATGDPVLDIKLSDNPDNLYGYQLDVTAKQLGESRVFYIVKAESGFDIIKEIKIKVVEELNARATTLDLKAEPIDKPSE